MFDEIKQRREEERERAKASDAARIASAFADIPVAFGKLISFTIRNLPWILLTLTIAAVVLIIKVPAVQDQFIEALTGALK